MHADILSRDGDSVVVRFDAPFERAGALALPPSELKRMRRELTELLRGTQRTQAERHITTGIALEKIAPLLPAVDDQALRIVSSGGGRRAEEATVLLVGPLDVLEAPGCPQPIHTDILS